MRRAACILRWSSGSRIICVVLVMCAAGSSAGVHPAKAAETAAVRAVSAQSGEGSSATHSGSYRIAGTVISKADGRPLGRARVTAFDVRDPKKTEFRITGDDGKFEFTNVPAGKYSLNGAKRGFISAAYDAHGQFSTAIVTGAGLDTETLELKLAPDAVIGGKVLDEVGDPVRHATVTLYREDHSGGESRIRPGRTAQTDDRGEYEITPLQPGTYFLSVTAKPWYAVHPPSAQADAQRQASFGSSSATSSELSSVESSEEVSGNDSSSTLDRGVFDVTYPITYYPDVTSADSAIPIPIQGGERLQLDFHLNPVPSLRLLFRVPKQENGGYNIPSLQQPAFDGFNYVQGQGQRMVRPGVWEVSGIPAGSYNLVINTPDGPQQLNDVNLSKDGEEIDTSKSEALVKVRATVQMLGEKSPPRLTVSLRAGSRQVAVASTPDPNNDTSKKEASKDASKDGPQKKNPGELEFESIPPGKYEFSVFGQGNRYYVARISATGAEVAGHTLIVAQGSSPSVTLTVVSGSADVEGVVKKSGKPFAGAMVVLVPQNPESDFDLFRRDQTDQDGTFILHNVIAGAYTALAIEDGWDLDWSKAGVISAYLKRGRKIEVGGNVGAPVKIVQPIEVQTK